MRNSKNFHTFVTAVKCSWLINDVVHYTALKRGDSGSELLTTLIRIQITQAQNQCVMNAMRKLAAFGKRYKRVVECSEKAAIKTQSW